MGKRWDLKEPSGTGMRGIPGAMCMNWYIGGMVLADTYVDR